MFPESLTVRPLLNFSTIPSSMGSGFQPWDKVVSLNALPHPRGKDLAALYLYCSCFLVFSYISPSHP
jgi:hypothetical protein